MCDAEQRRQRIASVEATLAPLGGRLVGSGEQAADGVLSLGEDDYPFGALICGELPYGYVVHCAPGSELAKRAAFLRLRDLAASGASIEQAWAVVEDVAKFSWREDGMAVLVLPPAARGVQPFNGGQGKSGYQRDGIKEVLVGLTVTSMEHRVDLDVQDWGDQVSAWLCCGQKAQAQLWQAYLGAPGGGLAGWEVPAALYGEVVESARAIRAQSVQDLSQRSRCDRGG